MKANKMRNFSDNEGNEYYMTENGFYYVTITYNNKKRSYRISKQNYDIAKELYCKTPLNFNY